MQLFYPIGLLALAGLIIPIVIHLWNVKKQQPLKIGSVSLLGESAQVTSKSYRITEWLLFLLRCLLVALIAILLAQPHLAQTIEAKNRGGWILIEKSKLPMIYKQERRSIDSLLGKGYEIHDFNIGFALLALEDTAIIKNEIAKHNIAYSSLLNQLNTLVPSGTPVYLYANKRLNRFEEKMPIINYQLRWKTIKNTDTISSWITQFAGKKLEAKSTQTVTSYKTVANTENPVINIAISENGGGNDRKYVVAALNAIAGFSNRKIEINNKGRKYDIGFWLSEQQVTPAFKNSIKTRGQLLLYAPGKEIRANSIINTDAGRVVMNKRIVSDKEFPKVWTDGFGNGILSAQIVGDLTFLHFYSRFNPQWNDLVWSETFVRALMPIVIKDQNTGIFGFEDNENDQRILSTVEPGYIENPEITKGEKIASSKSLGNGFWIAALLIFALERILSLRKKTTNVKN